MGRDDCEVLNICAWFVGPTSRLCKLFNRRRERERNLYFSVVTGTHYGTKTPPDQQPTKLSQGYGETRRYLQYVYGYGLKGTLPGLVCYSVGSIVARAVRV